MILKLPPKLTAPDCQRLREELDRVGWKATPWSQRKRVAHRGKRFAMMIVPQGITIVVADATMILPPSKHLGRVVA